MSVYNYLVVGAGPAGLAFASALEDPSTLVIDMGKPVDQRDRFNPEECIQGGGGAGLFSDGKFSFYPSGTKIWTQDRMHLQRGYERLKQDLSPFHEIPSFPEIDETNKLVEDKSGWLLKSYESIYLDLHARIQLIHNLAMGCLNIHYQTEFVEYDKTDNGYDVRLKTLSDGSFKSVSVKKIIWAGGRFMPLFLKCAKVFQRYEFGFRIEGPISLIKKEVNLIDPKHIYMSGDVEYRTFCWCENGEVVQTLFKDIATFSGRADCLPTGRSNFGFNCRVKDSSLISKRDFKELMRLEPYEVKLKQIDQIVINSPSVKKILDIGVAKIKERFSDLNNNEIEIIGPTIEGVGEYPKIDDDFQVEGLPGIYVIGDCSGIYRGIVASMLSGYILASKTNNKE